MTPSFAPRALALLLSVGLVAGACGAGSPSGSGPLTIISDDTAGDPEPAADEAASGEEPDPTARPEVPTAAPVTEDEPAPEPSPTAAAEPAGENQLPNVNVIDIATGDEVLLSSYAPAATPIVLWFWAPH
jgi:hypothetical protein